MLTEGLYGIWAHEEELSYDSREISMLHVLMIRLVEYLKHRINRNSRVGLIMIWMATIFR